MPGAQYYDGKKLNIPISTESGIELIERWVHQGISSIMSSIANQHLDKLNEYERNRIYKCSKAADDIYKQARCVVQAIDATPKQRSHIWKLEKLLSKRLNGTAVGALFRPGLRPTSMRTGRTEKMEFRTRRSVANRQHYKLRTEYDLLTPFGLLGKSLSKLTKIFKNKDPKLSWEAAMNNIESARKRAQTKERIGEELKKRYLFNKDFKHLESKLTPGERRLAKELRIPISAIKGIDEDDRKKKKVLEIIRLFQRAVKLAMVINGANSTEIEDKTLKFASPRFLSVVPDKIRDEVSVMSPSLFSIHEQGKGLEALASVPRLLKAVHNHDYQEWLNFIIEASGTADAIDKLQEVEMLPPNIESMPVGIDGQPMYFTKDNLTEIDPELARKLEIFEKLTRSLTVEQLAEFNATGFSVMTTEQLLMVYGPDSPFGDSKTLDFFLSLKEDDVRRHILQNIRDIAKMRTAVKIRRKRAVLSPILLSSIVFDPAAVSIPVILSPVLLTLLLFSPSIFGTVIVSPWLFVAVILSPRIMCPVVLSPVALSTITLSPLIMDPLILSPGALLPFVLSPQVLSPVILSPNVLSPLILSPFVLSPNVFSPVALTALVASPFALSPFVFTHIYIAALLFSPHAFSPRINTTGKAVTILFSPSIFS